MTCELWLKIITLLIQIGTFIVLLCTLLKVIEYTKETAKLRKETVRQTELQLRPCLTMRARKLMNIGHSPALNIRIDPLEIQNKKYPFQEINLLRPSEQEPEEGRAVELKKENVEVDKAKVEEINKKFPWVIDKYVPEKIYDLTIRYNNIENQPYKSIIRVHRKEEIIELLETGKDD